MQHCMRSLYSAASTSHAGLISCIDSSLSTQALTMHTAWQSVCCMLMLQCSAMPDSLPSPAEAADRDRPPRLLQFQGQRSRLSGPLRPISAEQAGAV